MKATAAARQRKPALRLLRQAGIILTAGEKAGLEIADFGLGDFKRIGLAIVTYINTERYCAKELVMLPGQICPEHRHPSVSGRQPGKMETFRCRSGSVALFTEGEPALRGDPILPEPHAPFLTVRRNIRLMPGEQYTIPANTLHWFQAGPAGAVISEFSSPSHDEKDIFTDPRIRRIPVMEKG